MDKKRPAYSINSLTHVPPLLLHLLLLPRSLCLNNSGLLAALAKVSWSCVCALVCMTDWILPPNFFFSAFNDQIRARESDKMHTWDAPLFALL